jgi:hypothetical protein
VSARSNLLPRPDDAVHASSGRQLAAATLKAGGASPRAAAIATGQLAEVCPLIPGRLKYTCSGRCKGCDATAPTNAMPKSSRDNGSHDIDNRPDGRVVSSL